MTTVTPAPPKTTEPIRAGDAVTVQTDKARPAVVLLLGKTVALVWTGTHTHRPHDTPFRKVEPQTREGRSLQLDGLTYFYRSGIVRVERAKLLARRGRCHAKLLLDLRELAESFGAVVGFLTLYGDELDIVDEEKTSK